MCIGLDIWYKLLNAFNLNACYILDFLSLLVCVVEFGRENTGMKGRMRIKREKKGGENKHREELLAHWRVSHPAATPASLLYTLSSREKREREKKLTRLSFSLLYIVGHFGI
jgi:hypothetical protein